jgi:ribosomal protein S18 acetylase RimI-like enzyme
MSSERVFLIAPVDAILIAEPTVVSRPIGDTEIRDVAQLVLDAYPGAPGEVKTLEDSLAKLERLLTGEIGEPRRDAWRGIWEGAGPPVCAILCTTWRGMPYIAQLVTAPNARNRGLASSLVREFAGSVQSTGGTHVGLMLKHGNSAMHLFRELGFVEMFTPAGL